MSTPSWHWTKQKNLIETKNKISVGWKNLEKRPFHKMGENRICPICSKEFYVKRCHILKGGGKYCSQLCGAIAKRNIPEEKHSSWKGNNVGYGALHDWVRKHKGKATKCEKCKKETKCHWHNVDGKYNRNLNDFISLCPSCHKLVK